MTVKSGTQCGFFLPFVLTTATQVRLVLADSAVGAATVTATIAAGTYYADLDADGAALGDNVLAEIVRALNAQEAADGTNGVTTLTVQSGNHTPRYTLSRAQGDAADDVTSLEVIGGELTLEDLGFSTGANAPDTATATADPATWTATKRPIRAWALEPPSAGRGRLVNAPEDESAIVAQDASVAITALETYGTLTNKSVLFFNVPAGAVFKYYTYDSGFAGVIGANAGDERAALEAFVGQWRALGNVNARFFADLSDLSTYKSLRPSPAIPWIAGLSSVVAQEGDGNALAYTFALSFYVV